MALSVLNVLRGWGYHRFFFLPDRSGDAETMEEVIIVGIRDQGYPVLRIDEKAAFIEDVHAQANSQWNKGARLTVVQAYTKATREIRDQSECFREHFELRTGVSFQEKLVAAVVIAGRKVDICKSAIQRQCQVDMIMKTLEIAQPDARIAFAEFAPGLIPDHRRNRTGTDTGSCDVVI